MNHENFLNIVKENSNNEISIFIKPYKEKSLPMLIKNDMLRTKQSFI